MKVLGANTEHLSESYWTGPNNHLPSGEGRSLFSSINVPDRLLNIFGSSLMGMEVTSCE